MKILSDNSIIPDFLLSSRFRFFRHLVLVAILAIICGGTVVSLPYYIPFIKMIAGIAGYTLFFLSAIYLNIYWGVPRFFLENRILAYLVFILGICFLILILLVFLQALLFKFQDEVDVINYSVFFLNIISSVVIMAFMLFGTTTMLLLKYWLVSTSRIRELEATNLDIELKQLKNQINPHFLFNMLNNTLVLLKENSRKASRILAELEGLLRYQIEKSAKKEICLKEDISFLKDFLHLEKVRRDNFEFYFSVEGETEGIFVPPLLFIPFVENAVKHSQDSEKVSFVRIGFSVSEEEILFHCENSVPSEEKIKERVGGLGLKNIGRRLELLFPDRHLLIIEDRGNKYIVKLRLTL